MRILQPTPNYVRATALRSTLRSSLNLLACLSVGLDAKFSICYIGLWFCKLDGKFHRNGTPSTSKPSKLFYCRRGVSTGAGPNPSWWCDPRLCCSTSPKHL